MCLLPHNLPYSPFPPLTHARFWSKVDVGDTAQCWMWRGHRNDKGYGVTSQGKAHRIAFEMVNGPIPDGALICHHCDNPSCVNPAHLYAGTAATNRADCVSRKRHNPSASHPRTKLSDADVAAIRESSDKGVLLAERYGVASSTISMIRSFKYRTAAPA